MKKWLISTGSMKRRSVYAPTPMIAAALAIAKYRPMKIGLLVECIPVPCRNPDYDIFYVSGERAFKDSGLPGGFDE